MRIKNFYKRVLALTLFSVGAIPLISNASAHTHLMYDASVKIQSAYIWRGLYTGGPNIQASATVGYGGAYANLWWNVGASDIRFKEFMPEVDITLGFARWGLNVNALYIHNFNCGFFDFKNRAGLGNRVEINLEYTISDKIPLTFHWASRVAAADGYYMGDELKFAYSSYFEINYRHVMRDGLSLYGAIGMSPWRSCYSGYEKDFALNNIRFSVRKDWSLSKHFGMRLEGQLWVNPIATEQVIHPNIACELYMK